MAKTMVNRKRVASHRGWSATHWGVMMCGTIDHHAHVILSNSIIHHDLLRCLEPKHSICSHIVAGRTNSIDLRTNPPISKALRYNGHAFGSIQQLNAHWARVRL